MLLSRKAQAGLTARAAPRSVKVQAASRPLWLPGADVPAHLNGE
jgi:hypothetical protein